MDLSLLSTSVIVNDDMQELSHLCVGDFAKVNMLQFLAKSLFSLPSRKRSGMF